eukprot:m.225897 g.225897  ORF g.225897 m.225897 type:complete len:841 (-) comp33472_c0_seq5:209-2731(-)
MACLIWFVCFAVLIVGIRGDQGVPSDVPSFVSPEFDCDVRKFAIQWAADNKLGTPSLMSSILSDALQIHTKCNTTDVAPATTMTLHRMSSVTTAGTQHPIVLNCSTKGDVGNSSNPHKTCLFVDAVLGEDDNSGNLQSPFKSIAVAINRVASIQGPTAVYLREGVHFLSNTLELDHRHSGMQISGYPGETAQVSGGVPITPAKWTKFSHNDSKGFTIWVANIGNMPQFKEEVPGLRVNGERMVRARHPNGNPETMGLHTIPTGWIPANGAESWLPGVAATPPKTPPIQVKVTTPSRASAYVVYPYYTNALGGLCNGLFTPNASFWCNPDNPRDGARGMWNGSGGVIYNATANLPDSKWSNSSRGVVHVWHNGGHWASQMYHLDSQNEKNMELTWTKGGFQDARADPEGAEWYVENVFEFLDASNEFFYSPEQRNLYVAYNGTTPPPQGSIIATHLQTLMNIQGNLTHPVVDVAVTNIVFRDAAQTFLEPHGVPSCGDWALQRMAGVFIERSERTLVDNCTFTRMDGNGVMLSKYNRNATISNSEFVYIGDTAMAAWGFTDEFSNNGTRGFDGTDGDFPRYTLIQNNVVRELGLYEKQSSAWFQAKSMQTTLRKNIFFNGPRAGINFNDGFGGGNIIENNLLFNFCRESSDHGPFNSWDRNMYLVHQPTDSGKPSVFPQYNTIHQNFLIANYNSQEGVDNDDGSGFYHTSYNFIVYGNYGQKVDMAGHDNFHFNNVYAYLKLCFVDLGGGETNKANRNGFHNNTCIQGPGVSTYAGINCADNTSMPLFANNQIYNPTGETAVCGIPLAKWQSMGNDPGTQVHKGIPTSKDILQFATIALNA